MSSYRYLQRRCFQLGLSPCNKTKAVLQQKIADEEARLATLRPPSPRRSPSRTQASPRRENSPRRSPPSSPKKSESPRASSMADETISPLSPKEEVLQLLENDLKFKNGEKFSTYRVPNGQLLRDKIVDTVDSALSFAPNAWQEFKDDIEELLGRGHLASFILYALDKTPTIYPRMADLYAHYSPLIPYVLWVWDRPLGDLIDFPPGGTVDTVERRWDYLTIEMLLEKYGNKEKSFPSLGSIIANKIESLLSYDEGVKQYGEKLYGEIVHSFFL